MNSTHTIGNWTTVSQWAQDRIGPEGGKVKVRVRGNILHILCESAPHAPSPDWVVSRLQEGLSETALETVLPADQPPIYQIWIYGRVSGPNYPEWTKQLDLSTLAKGSTNDRPPEKGQPSPEKAIAPPGAGSAVAARVKSSSPREMVVSNRNLAAEGNPHAIARYLSESLSPLGIGVKVKVKTLKRHNHLDTAFKRLHVGIYSNYSPDSSLLGPKIAGQLRELELSGFRDAAIACQVHGEPSPDWVLLVDLTPRSVMLHQWARWGDVPAINRLIDQVLAPETQLHISAILKESTLHLFCRGTTVPDQTRVTHKIQTLLDAIAPQGIHAVTIYGHLNNKSTPAWVDWLDLAAKTDTDLSSSTIELAQKGHQVALKFLLNRLLNPEIEQQLSTGGIRIQLLLKQDLLHVMSDAPVCPNQRQVGPLVSKFLRQLKIPGISGVRVYGRRAGQKMPRWNYGVDFKSRKRLVPEAPPEFAASSAYVGDLIALDQAPHRWRESPVSPSSDLLPNSAQERAIATDDRQPASLQNKAPESELTKSVRATEPRPKVSLVQRFQQGLVRSGLLAPNTESEPISGALSSYIPVQETGTILGDRGTYRWRDLLTPQLMIALVWSALGLLLTVEIDWFLGYKLTQLAGPNPSKAAMAPGYLGLGGDPANASDESWLENQKETSEECAESSCLSPPSPYPTFNNQLIDEHLGRYHALMLEQGAPDVLIIGSSRALRGIDPQQLGEDLAAQGYEDVSIYNFGINGATAKVVDWVIRELLTPEQLPKVIIWADGTRAFNSGREDLTYEAIAASDGYQQLQAQTLTRPEYGTPWSGKSSAQTSEDNNQGLERFSITQSYEQANDWLEAGLGSLSAVYPQRDRLHGQIQKSLSKFLPEQTSPTSLVENPEMLQPAILNPDGFLPFNIRFDPNTYYEHHPQVSGAYDRDYESFSLEGEQDEALKNTMAYTQEMGVNLVFVNMPLTDVYLDPARMEFESEFQDYLRTQEDWGLQVQDWILLWSGGEYDYFSDPSHLNRYGAEAIASELAQTPEIDWREQLTINN
ncbi:DUF1574 domain-containing protein [Roseofilum sp. BLCC_M91]|uniref:DUF1574 domain-containing protein n=1 Tax=Roseofilum halophilum BLCC-M91 TaxID=3022259 RepID=A0ABT7BG96_9CYAN|nr:hypothetical protein [Roseofilum halophilum]MDJ1178203.1 DUF1574 domain-containing protein [Roseofilum halophilum BLCC-M91]